MIDKNQIPYQDIKLYLMGEKEINILSDISQKYPVYGVFSTIKKLGSYLTGYNFKKEFCYDDAENILQDFLAGTLNQNNATYVLNAICRSKSNFDKLLYKVNANIKIIEEAFINNSEVTAQKENQEIIREIETLKFKKSTRNQYFIKEKKAVYAILSAAAVFLILFISPYHVQNSVENSYNFDNSVPIDYSNSKMRDSHTSQNNYSLNTKRFVNQFEKGMADYLAFDYRRAISHWEKLKLNERELEEINGKIKEEMYLYLAVSYMALLLSDKEMLRKEEKESLINQSLLNFEQVIKDSDLEKYNFALCLALSNDKKKALKFLEEIDAESEFYLRKIHLQELLLDKKEIF